MTGAEKKLEQVLEQYEEGFLEEALRLRVQLGICLKVLGELREFTRNYVDGGGKNVFEKSAKLKAVEKKAEMLLKKYGGKI